MTKLDDAVVGPAILEAAATAHLGIAVTLVSEEEVRNIYLSDEAVRILGGTREELLSVSALSRIAPEEAARVASFVERRRRGTLGSQVLETVIVRPDGARVPIAVASNRVIIDRTPASVSFFWDLTELRSAEEGLSTERERLRSLIDASPDGIIISCDGGDEILYANTAIARLLGLADARPLIGTSLAVWVAPDETGVMRQRMSRVNAGEVLTPRAYRVKRADGMELVVEIVSRPFVHEGRRANLAFARDVTERVRLQERLAQADRLAALGTLAAGVAHEINNPLTTSTLSLELLGRAVEKLPVAEATRTELRSLVTELQKGTDRVASIVRDLRTFARPEEKVGPLDLRKVLLAAEGIARHATRYHATVVREGDATPLVIGNEGRLEQVFVNLLVNAAQALPEGRRENEIRVRTFVAGDGRVAVEVRDNGAGIAPEHLPRLFDPFFTTKPVGLCTGLGLAISHGIVTRLGGTLEVESELGVGTTMRVLLPAAGGPAEVERAESTAPAPARAGRVLIIDDDVSLATSLGQTLCARHEVVVQSDPRRALELLVGGATFDVVLCDVMMPELTGIELYQRLAVSRPGTEQCIVFTSGGAWAPGVRSFLATTGRPVLEKPFRVEQAEELIARILAGEAQHAR